MRTIKAAKLVKDFTIYPREKVDGQHVNEMMAAMADGTTFPPVIVEKTTLRIVDGFHRVTAALRLYGEEAAEVEAIEQKYKSEGDLFLDCVRRNAGHGRKLSAIDKTRCVLLASQLAVEDAQLGAILHVDVDAMADMRLTKTAINGELHVKVPIKRGLRHMAGRTLTRGQVETNRKFGGNDLAFYANQISMAITNEMLDRENAKCMDALVRLRDLLAAADLAVLQNSK